MAASEQAQEVIDLGPGAGKFLLLKLLGRGGMAEVFLASKVGGSTGTAGFQRLVALKRVLASHLKGDDAESYRRSVLDEGQVLAQLRHPAICSVTHLVEQGRDLYLELEWIEGIDLGAAVAAARRRGRGFSVGFAAYVIGHVADALDYAWNTLGSSGRPLHVIHRDLKPSNIMLGNLGQVKLLDFGVAHSALEGRDVTRVGLMKGTPNYMSPEQATGAPGIDTRADVFCLGIVLCELLTLRRPFDAPGQGDTAVVLKVVSADPADVARACEGLPASMREIIGRCLAREPADRYQRPADVADALRAALRAVGVQFDSADALREVAEATKPGADATARQVRPPIPEAPPPAAEPPAAEQTEAGLPGPRLPAAALEPTRVRAVPSPPRPLWALVAGGVALVLVALAVVWLTGRGGGPEAAPQPPMAAAEPAPATSPVAAPAPVPAARPPSASPSPPPPPSARAAARPAASRTASAATPATKPTPSAPPPVRDIDADPTVPFLDGPAPAKRR